jgi:hypothetical protein
MTDRLEEIRQRATAAIPGPWRWQGNVDVNRCYLATTDRGQLTIMLANSAKCEYVFDRVEGVGRTLEEAREGVLDLCGSHEGGPYEGEPGYDCICTEIATFLEGTVDSEEGTRSFSTAYGCPPNRADDIVRGVQSHVDIMFPAVERAAGRREELGARLYPYSRWAKYEVLGYRSKAEWVMDQAGVIPSAGGDMEDFLYRKDFVGLDQPEAAFIEHSRDDIDWLLAKVDELQEALDARYTT